VDAEAREMIAAAAAADVEARAKIAVTAEVTGMNTGTSEALVPGVTAVKDYNPLLQLAFLSGALDEGAGGPGEGFVLDLNNFLGLPIDDGYKLQLLGRDAELYTPIRDAFPEADRDRIAGELGKDLGRTDDLSLVFSYSPMGKALLAKIGLEETTFGRNPALYQEALSNLFQSVRAGFARRHDADLMFDSMSDDDRALINEGKLFSSLSDQEMAGKYMAAVEAEERARFQRRAALEAELEDVGFLRFAELVANQPQLTVDLEQTARDPLVGPDELKVKGSFEVGFGNVNGLLRKCGGAVDAGCYEKFLEEEPVAAGNRFTVSFSYSQVDDFSFSRPEDGVELEIEGARTLTASLAYGRYLGLGLAEALAKSRFDVNWSYEDVGDDPNRKSRHLATAILSLPMADGTSFQVGLTYSDEPEFLSEVEEELSARLGLTYKLKKPTADT
jgi:hypothetical protein